MKPCTSECAHQLHNVTCLPHLPRPSLVAHSTEAIFSFFRVCAHAPTLTSIYYARLTNISKATTQMNMCSPTPTCPRTAKGNQPKLLTSTASHSLPTGSADAIIDRLDFFLETSAHKVLPKRNRGSARPVLPANSADQPILSYPRREDSQAQTALTAAVIQKDVPECSCTTITCVVLSPADSRIIS